MMGAGAVMLSGGMTWPSSVSWLAMIEVKCIMGSEFRGRSSNQKSSQIDDQENV
jgi:hypothetical protein